MNQTVRTVLMWLVILIGVLLIFSVLRNYSTTSREIAFSQFLDTVAAGDVEKVLIKGEEIHIRSAGGDDTGSGADFAESRHAARSIGGNPGGISLRDRGNGNPAERHGHAI